ncbi:MAG: hypothetical protein FJ186_02235 [Gammaproteobacteria bacterium]|nr:hypothetical protein [Gammaproteobacteria bacterium]
MLEFHGTCTIIALKKERKLLLLKLMMGGLNECAQDNFPLGNTSWINAVLNTFSDHKKLFVGDEVKICGIDKNGQMEVTSIRLVKNQ